MIRIMSVISAKVAMKLARLAGHKGTNLGGEVALRLYPDILGYYGTKVKESIVFVTGTNGKTSTNNMIYSIIRESGALCVSNRLGANLDAGLVSAFIDGSDVLGRIGARYACLEVDESTLPKVMKRLKPDVLLMTNIFRERRDKPSDINNILGNIKESLAGKEDILLIINADDPPLAAFSEGLPNPKIYFGLGHAFGTEETFSKEVECGVCGGTLTYARHFYGDLGHYRCKNCGFIRPEPDYKVSLSDRGEGLRAEGPEGFCIEAKVNSLDTYNGYNVLAAVTYAATAGFKGDDIIKGIEVYEPQLGRMERFQLDKPVILNLAKNPVGFNESMKVVLQDKRPKAVILGINDLPQDGTDVSWLWDTNFEMLKDALAAGFAVFGRRASDMVRRLADAGIEPSMITIIEASKVAEFAAQRDELVVYVLVNYSLLFETQGLLRKWERRRSN